MTSNKNNKVYPFSDTYFVNRLRNIGFTNLEFVIDAACGYGDWLPALSKLNRNVVGFDLYSEAIKGASRKMKDLSAGNINLFLQSMYTISFKPSTIDGIFCFDSFFLGNPYRIISEFHRILKTNGKLYLSINGIGWISQTLFYRGIWKRDLSKINMAIRILLDTFIRRYINKNYNLQNTVFTIRDIENISIECGFRIIYSGYEGTYNNENYYLYPPCFNKKYFGLPGSLEIILEKI